MERTNPDVIKRIMAEQGLRFRKALGQNFLIDETVLQRALDASGIDASYGVIEIGPGIGTLTEALAERAGAVAAIELDRSIAAYLQGAFAANGNVHILQGDALQMDLRQVIDAHLAGRPLAVVANLPYYITTPLLMKFLEGGLPFETITVMVQKEVAERITADAGTKAYGAISAAVRYYGDAEIVTLVPPSCFMPPPKVTSAVLKIDLKNHKKPEVADEKLLFRVIRAAFGQRRKTLVNALASAFSIPKAQLRDAVVHVTGCENIRGEQLDLRQFIQISEKLR